MARIQRDHPTIPESPEEEDETNTNREFSVTTSSSQPVEVTNRPSTYVIENDPEDEGIPLVLSRESSYELVVSRPIFPDLSAKNVWNLAVAEVRSNRDKLNNYHSTLIVVGSQAVGKSTMIQQFLGGKGPLQPTNGIEFSLGKETVFKVPTTVCHVYEVGGAITDHADLMEPPIKYCQYPDKLTLIVVLDLTKPAYIWDTVQMVLEYGRNAFKKTLEELKVDLSELPVERLRERMAKLVKTASGVIPDLREVPEAEQPFPLPIGIVGAKYDEYQKFPLEEKEKISKCVRLIALKLRAAICFYSNKDPMLKVRIKEFFSYYAYGLPFPGGKNVECELPILIPEGTDDMRYITTMVDTISCTWVFIRGTYAADMGIKFNIPKPVCDPSKDSRYADSRFDKRRELAMKEIEDFTDARRARDALSDENFFAQTDCKSTTELSEVFREPIKSASAPDMLLGKGAKNDKKS